jgi:hypothetical protein
MLCFHNKRVPFFTRSDMTWSTFAYFSSIVSIILRGSGCRMTGSYAIIFIYKASWYLLHVCLLALPHSLTHSLIPYYFINNLCVLDYQCWFLLNVQWFCFTYLSILLIFSLKSRIWNEWKTLCSHCNAIATVYQSS